MAPAAARPWADPRIYIPIMLQTIALVVIGVQWQARVDKDISALQAALERVANAQASTALTIGDHAGRIVRVETQVVALEPALARLQTTLDRAMRFMPLEQRGSAGALPRLP